MQLPDYYAILGVAPNADVDTIRRAYRKRATECHPDHGGTHEAMVAVTTAWFVLSDPTRRQEYDAARSAAASGYQQQKAQDTTRQAQEYAQQYPRRWNDFEIWLNTLGQDFMGAKYGTTQGPQGVVFPTSKESLSAGLFIVGGGLLGGLLGLFMAAAAFRSGAVPMMAIKSGLIAVAIFAAGGAWLGRILHGGIASLFPATPPSSHSTGNPPEQVAEAEAVHRIVACPACGQKLRLPVVNRVITATCPKCRQRFDVSASG